MSLIDKYLKLKIPGISKLEDSPIIKNKSEYFDLGIPALNVAFSGKVYGGCYSGIHIFAGPSKTGKTLLALICAAAYLRKYPDSVMVLIDSEGGASLEYFKAFGIDTSRVLHYPVTNIEELKFTHVKFLEGVESGERVVTVIDSIGNLASKKEVDDALKESSAADLSRSRQIKSLFRIITPYYQNKNIPLFAINHVYQSIGLFSSDIMGGGSGPLYSGENIFFLSKAQEKDGTELAGFKFTLKAEKSRSIREKSKFALYIDFEKGIDRYSDLFTAALDLGFITSPKQGWYATKYNPEKSLRKSAFEFVQEGSENNIWDDFLGDEEFISAYEKRYSLSSQSSRKNKIEEIQESEEIEGTTSEELTEEAENDTLSLVEKAKRGRKKKE